MSVKKKIVDAPLAFRSAAIKPFTRSSNTATPGSQFTPANTTKKQSDAKLIIETAKVETTVLKEDMAAYTQPESKSILAADEGRKTGSTKISALNKIRQQYQDNSNNGNGNINHALQLEELQKAWAEYVVKLKEAKNPAAQSFELALLRVKDSNSFEAVTANTIEKQFIEQDRNKLFAFLQDRLQNRSLQFNVMIEEKAENRPQIEITLSSKEQFLKMAEQYPMVKELKDRLRLELDY